MQSSSYRTCLICGSSFKPRTATAKTCSLACRNESFRDPTALGKKRVRPDGYIGVYVGHSKWLLEHRLVMEQLLGRKLDRREQVHHKDHDRQNNSPENLELTTIGQHMRDHHSGLRWSRNFDACIVCETVERRHAFQGMCWLCNNRYKRAQKQVTL